METSIKSNDHIIYSIQRLGMLATYGVVIGGNLSEVFGTKQTLRATKNGVLIRVVRVILGWDLQNGGHGRRMAVDGVSDQFGHILVDENDVDVVPLEERPERVLHFSRSGVLVHH